MKTTMLFPFLVLTMVALAVGQTQKSEAPNEGVKVSKEHFEAFCRMHVGEWKGKVASTIGEVEITKSDEESVNYLDWDYNPRTMLLSTSHYGPRGGGKGVFYYDARAKVIRSKGFGNGGVVTHHEMFPEDDHWFRATTQVLPDGTLRRFKSTIRFSDNNNTITVVIHLVEGDRVVSTQTNVWNRIK